MPNDSTVDATTAPILQIWAQLDEIQRAKALAYAEGLRGATSPDAPTPMAVAINQSQTLARQKAKEVVMQQQAKKDI